MDIRQMRANGMTWEAIEAAMKQEKEALMREEEATYNKLQIQDARKAFCDSFICYMEALGLNDAAETRDEIEDLLISYEDVMKKIITEYNTTGTVTPHINLGTIMKFI